jgi:hypothetical protein
VELENKVADLTIYPVKQENCGKLLLHQAKYFDSYLN